MPPASTPPGDGPAPPKGPPVRRAIARLLAALGVLTLGLTLLAPWLWPAELLASFRPHLVVADVLLAVTCLALLRPLPALVLLLVAGANLAPVVAVTSGSRSVPLADGPTVLVAHQNAQGGAGSSPEVLQHLAAHPVDVLVLLDPAPDWGEFLRGPAAEMGYQEVVPEQGLAEHQVVVLSRIPIQAVEVPDGEGLPPATVALAIPLGDEVVQALAVHTRNPLTPWRWDTRNEQLDAIARWAREQAGPAMVFGDLNLAPWSPTATRFQHDSGLVSSGEGRPSQASWPWWPGWLRDLGIPIDHLLHTPDLAVVARDVQPSIGSQHGVLAVEVGLAAEPG